MSILVDAFGSPLRSGGNRRFLEVASRNGRHPSEPIRSEGIRKSVDWHDLAAAVSVSRRLYANNGIFRGIIAQKNMFAIGQAFLPIFKGKNRAWGEKARKWLVDVWYPNSDVRGGVFDFQTGLFLDAIALDRDGDFGVLFTKDSDGFPKLQRIAQHRIKSWPHERFVLEGRFKGLPIYQGVIYNRQSCPVGYRVFEDPIDPIENTQFKFDDIPAPSMQHLFEPEWYDQGRGFPMFTHGLNQFRSMATSQEWEEMSMLIASAIGLIEKNDVGAEDSIDPSMLASDANQDGGIQSMTFEGGLVRYFRSNSGAGLEQFISHKPGAEWEMFNDRLVRIVALGANWPLGMVWKPEGGGTDTRNAILQARQSVADRQSLLLPIAKQRIIFAIACAVEMGALPPCEEFMEWGFSLPPRIGIDDGREQKERRENLKVGLSTYRDEIAAAGGDWQEVRTQQEEETRDLLTRANRLSKEFGVPIDIVINLLQQRNPNQQIMIEDETVDTTALANADHG